METLLLGEFRAYPGRKVPTIGREGLAETPKVWKYFR